MNSSIKEAKRTLINNRRLNYTLPTNTKLYPAQWNWDSAFIALGYSNFNLDYSFKELETLISGQWDDGMIPHILFHIKDLNYTPNYKAWNCGKKVSSSGITQPPILASILRIIIERQKFSKKEIKKYQPLILKIKKCLEWFIKYRDPKRTGLISILHPWESGYDNSPLWDKPMSKIKTELNLNYKRKDNKNKDIRNNSLVAIPSITNFFMLFADLNNNSINRSLIKSLKKYNKNNKYLFPSINSKHKSFEEKRYWRGPVWVNCNWIIYQGLKNKDKKFAETIRKKTLNLVEKKKFREYYSCKSGLGMGAKNFSWTAALYLDFKLNSY